MAVETSLFAQAIQEHLELKQRNSALEREMPIDTYKSDDPFENPPLFKTEEQARLEETMDGSEPAVVTAPQAWPGEESATVESVPAAAATAPTNSELEDSLWGKESRDFDWGD
jgi:hypothetical protein